jgi:hypothetical protein
MEGLVINVNSVKHVQQRMLSTSATPSHPIVSILLLSDKYETSPIYAALSYNHRHDGFVAFGESRGSNAELAKEFGVKRYPTVLALIGTTPVADAYTGSSFDLLSLSKWVDGLQAKHFKRSSEGASSRRSGDKKKKKQRAR